MPNGAERLLSGGCASGARGHIPPRRAGLASRLRQRAQATAFAAPIPFVAPVRSLVEPHAWREGLRLPRFHSIVKPMSPETASNDAAKRRSARLRACRQRRPDRRPTGEDVSRGDDVAAGFAMVKPESETEVSKVGPGRRPTQGPQRPARNRRRGAWLVGSIRGRHAHR